MGIIRRLESLPVPRWRALSAPEGFSGSTGRHLERVYEKVSPVTEWKQTYEGGRQKNRPR